MTNIELYIDKKLCDIQSPEKLGVRLNRVLINPAELSTKDAQYSYSITIPATPTNDAIFGYANVEEVKNKFNHNYKALLYVNSILIFDGRFKLSEIDAEGSYKGNLVVPAKKTIKEIFGEKKMTEIEGSWDLSFTNPDNENEPLTITEMLNKYNTEPGTPDCIFPLVLYGLLPKVSKDGENSFSGKAIWDKYVRLGIEDFPPSINCLNTIKKIFENSKDEKGEEYHIGGSAFEDARLKNLYMSYQNPTNYQQEWNWGYLGRMKLKGTWTNIKNDNKDIEASHLETEFYVTQGDCEHVAVNLFNARNSDITVLEDTGSNISQSEHEKGANRIIKNTHIVIPTSGLYKVKFGARMKVGTSAESKYKAKYYTINDTRFSYSNSHDANNEFNSSRYELKLIRDRGNGDFDMTNSVIDGIYYKNNHNQEMDKSGGTDRKYNFPLFATSPKYFPQANPQAILFVDPCQNPNIISGFRWGKGDEEVSQHPLDKNDFYCNILSAKNGLSWDKTVDTVTYSAVNSLPYWRYGILQEDEEPTEPTEEGEDGEESEVDEATREYGYEMSDKFITKFDSPENYIGKKNNLDGDGLVHTVIWLEKGEHIALSDVTDIGVWREGSRHKYKGAYIKHEVEFEIEIEPYKLNKEWLTVNSDGTGTTKMSWNEESDFNMDKINLIKFLPSGQKIDDWLENFCKAFNLDLMQPKENEFELNVKQIRPTASAASVIDLDGKASINQRTNQSLGLPSEFQLGFKVNQEEEGYFRSKELNGEIAEDGGGSFITGNIDGQVVTQASNFSYNWFKKIYKGEENAANPMLLELPVITNKQIWELNEPKDYGEMMKKLYTDYAQRFWYKAEKPYNVGIVWSNTDKHIELLLPHLSNSLNKQDTLTLDYYNNPSSILTIYFSIIATDDSNYTYIECYLTPDEYEQMDGSKLVKLNGDLYYVAAVEGYDPMGRNKTKLKLIRKV
ncbi:hypothetical protein CLV62_101466 [Dysgonomonas alginatilytica]|uniref:Uncharacterized protein n=1 Tax=Dysgonomonas alginatilytica TaxID=1605892 RepID=A0A2V3PU11_9BACT|nr:hypothetical protein [Dysgonomonas alginatilytica]PXV69197.1 hypothetical protein CLV62_101466 [Dysgonomonas alginatilytica]